MYNCSGDYEVFASICPAKTYNARTSIACQNVVRCPCLKQYSFLFPFQYNKNQKPNVQIGRAPIAGIRLGALLLNQVCCLMTATTTYKHLNLTSPPPGDEIPREDLPSLRLSSLSHIAWKILHSPRQFLSSRERLPWCAKFHALDFPTFFREKFLPVVTFGSV